jgi:hypothetical protein
VPATILAGTYDVSPELAREVAYSMYNIPYFTAPEREYPVEMSEPKVYLNIDGKVKYYVFYFYGGQREMPSWDELEKSAIAGEIPDGRWYSFIISGDKRLAPCVRGDFCPPRVILNIKEVRERLESEHPRGNWRYAGTRIELTVVFYVFRSGGEEVITNMFGEIIDPKDVRLDMGILTQETIDKNRQEWEEIEERAEERAGR